MIIETSSQRTLHSPDSKSACLDIQIYRLEIAYLVTFEKLCMISLVYKQVLS